jgi:hypothetical protein
MRPSYLSVCGIAGAHTHKTTVQITDGVEGVVIRQSYKRGLIRGGGAPTLPAYLCGSLGDGARADIQLLLGGRYSCRLGSGREHGATRSDD